MIALKVTVSEQDEDEMKIADDFRRQLQERFPAYEGDAAKDVDEMRDNPKLEEFMSTLGLGAGRNLIGNLLDELGAKVVPNPRDDPFTHKIIQDMCTEVESACRRAGVPLRGGVSYGVSPTFAVNAEMHAVPTTETSVVQVSAGFLLFCSHLSKAVSQSIPHELVGDVVSLDSDPSMVMKRVAGDADLKRLWLELFGAYAYGGGPLDIEWRIVPHPHSLTRAMLLHAFELFAIAHEYGHHVTEDVAMDVLEVGGDPEALSKEFEADVFAFLLCRYIEREKNQPNVFLISGVAPVILLKCLDLVHRTRGIFAGREVLEGVSNTHPETEERISAFDLYDDGTSPELANKFRQMRLNYCKIIDTIWTELRPLYVRMYENGLRVEESQATWLPGLASKR
jgi:hypothetical protein